MKNVSTGKQVVELMPEKKAVKKKATAVVEKDDSMGFNIETLISQAIAKGSDFPIETMEKLLAMRRELKAEWAQEEYFKALASFQQACPEIKKTKEVHSREGKLIYRYAPLEVIIEQCKDLLKENGFSYNIRSEQQADSVTAICISHHIAGHSEESALTIPIDPKAYMNVAQKVASALTYAKRYAFNNTFGIMTGDEDDDAKIINNEDQKTEEEVPKDEKKTNGKKTWPKAWEPILAEINDMLVEAPFDKNDRKDVYANCLKCKSIADLCFIRDEWKKESEKRTAKQESLDETAGKVFDDEKLNPLLPIEDAK